MCRRRLSYYDSGSALTNSLLCLKYRRILTEPLTSEDTRQLVAATQMSTVVVSPTEIRTRDSFNVRPLEGQGTYQLRKCWPLGHSGTDSWQRRVGEDWLLDTTRVAIMDINNQHTHLHLY